MKQYLTKHSIADHLLTGLTGFFWVSGLLLAGSESPYMPWVNLAGLTLFFLSSLVLGKRLHALNRPNGTLIRPTAFKKQSYTAGQTANRRCHNRYAMSA